MVSVLLLKVWANKAARRIMRARARGLFDPSPRARGAVRCGGVCVGQEEKANGRPCLKFMSADVIPPKSPPTRVSRASCTCVVVIDGFLGSTSAAAAVRTGIAQLDDNGMMRVCKIQRHKSDTANSPGPDLYSYHLSTGLRRRPPKY